MNPLGTLSILTATAAFALALPAAAQSAPAGAPASSVNTAGQPPVVRSAGHKVIVPVPPEKQDTATPRPTAAR